MNQGGGQKLLKLSQQQKDILLWLAKQEGRIRPKSPPGKQTKLAAYPRHMRGTLAVVEQINRRIELENEVIKRQEQVNEIVGRYERLNEQVRPLATLITNLEQTLGITIEGVEDSPPTQELDPEPQRPEPKPVRLGTRWRPEIYLGRPPTDSERVMLSNRLASLERQGLIKRTRNRGKRKRTTHLKLTREGIEVVNELLAVNNSQAAELPINNS